MKTEKLNKNDLCIRASVDALCRDGECKISQDPRTKCLN